MQPLTVHRYGTAGALPVVLLHGLTEAAPTSEMAPRSESLHNDAVRTVVVPDSGHCLRRDQPDRYHREVDAFLGTTEERLHVPTGDAS